MRYENQTKLIHDLEKIFQHTGRIEYDYNTNHTITIKNWFDKITITLHNDQFYRLANSGHKNLVEYIGRRYFAHIVSKL